MTWKNDKQRHSMASRGMSSTTTPPDVTSQPHPLVRKYLMHENSISVQPEEFGEDIYDGLRLLRRDADGMTLEEYKDWEQLIERYWNDSLGLNHKYKIGEELRKGHWIGKIIGIRQTVGHSEEYLIEGGRDYYFASEYDME
jgi:hypothetical protein